jgi:hypothetical protein
MIAGIDLRPPQVVADRAAKGLELREKHGRGGTHVGVARAKQLSARRELTPTDVKKMRAYFARHEVDKKAPKFHDKDDPSAGCIAWLLWGGDEGRAWAETMVERLKKAG